MPSLVLISPAVRPAIGNRQTNIIAFYYVDSSQQGMISDWAQSNESKATQSSSYGSSVGLWELDLAKNNRRVWEENISDGNSECFGQRYVSGFWNATALPVQCPFRTPPARLEILQLSIRFSGRKYLPHKRRDVLIEIFPVNTTCSKQLFN